MSSRIILDMEGRRVFWETDSITAAFLAQEVLRVLGPAQGVEEDD